MAISVLVGVVALALLILAMLWARSTQPRVRRSGADGSSFAWTGDGGSGDSGCDSGSAGDGGCSDGGGGGGGGD